MDKCNFYGNAKIGLKAIAPSKLEKRPSYQNLNTNIKYGFLSVSNKSSVRRELHGKSITLRESTYILATY